MIRNNGNRPITSPWAFSTCTRRACTCSCGRTRVSPSNELQIHWISYPSPQLQELEPQAAAFLGTSTFWRRYISVWDDEMICSVSGSTYREHCVCDWCRDVCCGSELREQSAEGFVGWDRTSFYTHEIIKHVVPSSKKTFYGKYVGVSMFRPHMFSNTFLCPLRSLQACASDW